MSLQLSHAGMSQGCRDRTPETADTLRLLPGLAKVNRCSTVRSRNPLEAKHPWDPCGHLTYS